MCGICGKLMLDPRASVRPALVKAMADTITHRGPDDEGFYIQGPVALGFRRLSIIDLSGGHQPIGNEDGTVQIIFNGEIYNYQELRAFLLSRGHLFRTQSDTEVIVHLYEELGEACVEKLRGMFAFALWDARTESLFLARDRVGIKPLYYALSREAVVFASEIKAIFADPSVGREVEPALIDRLLSFDYTPGSETLFKGIRKLSPGSYLIVRKGRVEIKQYWDLTFGESGLSLKEAEEKLLALLEESVRLHMISDVPIGFLLSGGLDSTAMLSLAAEAFATEHHEITVSSEDFADFLPKYVWHMEEPVCEPPAIALYYVSKLARQTVKVLISGEGGDEAFAGYPNYRNMLFIEKLKRALGGAKPLAQAGLAAANRLLRSRRLGHYLCMLDLPLESYYYSRTSTPSRFFNRHSAELYTADFAHMAHKNRSLEPLTELFCRAPGRDALAKMMYIDTKTWLPDDLLIKADKITMANSIELRVPLLDHRVLEFAASLPSEFKVRGFQTKFIAKRALSRVVPEAIVKRKKAGFPVPYASWLRTELKGWLDGILLDRRTTERGYFRKEAIEKMLSQDRESGGYSKELFTLAVLEVWHREFIDGKPAAVGEQLEDPAPQAAGRK